MPRLGPGFPGPGRGGFGGGGLGGGGRGGFGGGGGGGGQADSAAKAVILDLRQGGALPDFLSLRVMQNKVVGRCV